MTAAPPESVPADAELLREYAVLHSQTAFSMIVRRHLGLVYHCALRQTRGDEHMAEDVAQAVFMILARKAGGLPAGVVLAGWLFNTTRFAASNAMRTQRRRHLHEQLAATQSAKTSEPDPAWKELVPHLDTALTRLRPQERDAILLRYFQGMPITEVCASLNLSEEAARKRLQRGVAKLRDYFTAKRLTLGAGALEGMLAAQSRLIAPQGVHTSTLAAAGGAAHPAASAIAQATVRLWYSNWKVVTAAGLILIGIGAAVYLHLPAHAESSSTVARSAGTVAGNPTKPAAVFAGDSSLKNYPIAPGWPLALPGSITGTPAVADLEGNGKLDIIVPCETLEGASLRHPQPVLSAFVYAFHTDGTPVPGWPAQVVDPVRRQQKEQTGRYTELWSSSPTVAVGRDGKTRIVITTPYFLGFRVIAADGRVREFHGGSQWANVPVVDINGDGILDIITGAGVLTVNGGEVPGWKNHPIARRSGFAPCIGDALGEGHLQVFHLFATGDVPGPDIGGYDYLGRPLPGWPRKLTLNPASFFSFPPVMGDITGDGKMEIVGAYEHIYAWSADGKGVPSTTSDGTSDGIFKPDVHAFWASPSLADLDGDGKAEIVVFDNDLRAIRAWHGDGTGVGNADGIIAKLPSDCYGVSIADLGGDGIIDFFAGTYWVKWDPKTGKSTVINMLPTEQETNQTQPTIADLDGDGTADVIFGLRDGRVVVYQTHLACQPQWLQWPTANGNFQHTGCWIPPRKR